MPNEYFRSDSDQYYPAENLYFVLEEVTCLSPKLSPDQRQHECYNPDDRRCHIYRRCYQRQRNADRQCVDARSYRQHYNNAKTLNIGTIFRLEFERFPGQLRNVAQR